MSRPLPDKLRRVLVAMDALERRGMSPSSPNEIAYECGYEPGMARSGNHGRGNTQRVMGVAVHVNTALTALRARGLVYLDRRRDDLSGSAYGLTVLGAGEATGAVCDGLDANAARAEGKRVRF